MSTNNNVAYFELQIQSEIQLVQDQATSRTIYELIQYAKKKEKEAENRELRPRPDGTENAAYYRSSIDFNLIPTPSLVTTINDLLDYVIEIENLLANES